MFHIIGIIFVAWFIWVTTPAAIKFFDSCGWVGKTVIATLNLIFLAFIFL